MMIFLVIYLIVLPMVFLLYAVPCVVCGDGLELLGVVISAILAVFWPIGLVILIWDGINLCRKKLFTTS